MKKCLFSDPSALQSKSTRRRLLDTKEQCGCHLRSECVASPEHTRFYPTTARLIMFTIGLEGHGCLIRDNCADWSIGFTGEHDNSHYRWIEPRICEACPNEGEHGPVCGRLFFCGTCRSNQSTLGNVWPVSGRAYELSCLENSHRRTSLGAIRLSHTRNVLVRDQLLIMIIVTLS